MLVRCQQALLLMSLVAITLLTNISRAQDVIVVQDSQGQHTFEHVPSRVAALNWDIAEQVLALGVTPIAMPDIGEYRQWVMKPEVPDSVMDIGSRVEPNLQRLASLKPDVIIIASPQLDLMPRLQQIAPVLFFKPTASSMITPKLQLIILSISPHYWTAGNRQSNDWRKWINA